MTFAISNSEDEPMTTTIVRNFLETQQREATALAAASDLLDLEALDGPPAQRYIATFKCKGVVRTDNGGFAVAERFHVGIWLPDDYDEVFIPERVLFWIGPQNVLHPNIAPPLICPGHAYAGMPLVELLYQLFEMISYRKVQMNERDALNRSSCVWARNHRHLFPIDARALKRRSVHFDVTPVVSADSEVSR
jgi:hypothetical protein